MKNRLHIEHVVLVVSSPPLRPHLGQHSPTGVNGVWSPGQVRGGQERALQDTLPLEHTHAVQGEGLHWESCCENKRNRETDSYTQKYTHTTSRGEKKERKKQRDSEMRRAVLLSMDERTLQA